MKLYYIQEKISVNTYIDSYECNDRDFAIDLLIGFRKKYPTRKYRLVEVVK